MIKDWEFQSAVIHRFALLTCECEGDPSHFFFFWSVITQGLDIYCLFTEDVLCS